MTRKVLCAAMVIMLAAFLFAADIGGKFAFGFEQGVGVGGDEERMLGRGVSFKYCLSNVVALKAALGFKYSDKIEDITDPADNTVLYTEDKPRVDYTVAAYLYAARDNHFNPENMVNNESFDTARVQLGEKFKKTDIHLRILMAPEIFLFPNFSLEYKYGFDVALKKDAITVDNNTGQKDILTEPTRLQVDIIGDLNLLQSASVHFYF
jgi:hypothetical protein